MKIDLKELDCIVFLDAALAISNLINNNNPDMDRVCTCRNMILDLASEKQDTSVMIIMNEFLIETKIAKVHLVCELGPHFDALGGMITRVCLSKPDKADSNDLKKLLDYFLVLHEMFEHAQNDLHARRACFA